MENFKNFRLSDDAKSAVENYFSTNFLNSADVFHTLCNAQEEILVMQHQKKNLINLESVIEVLGLFQGLVEACLVDE